MTGEVQIDSLSQENHHHDWDYFDGYPAELTSQKSGR